MMEGGMTWGEVMMEDGRQGEGHSLMNGKMYVNGAGLSPISVGLGGEQDDKLHDIMYVKFYT